MLVNICCEKKPRETLVETFKIISTLGVQCQYIKDAFAGFCQQASQPALLFRCKSFIQYWDEICLTMQTSLLIRLGLFHVSRTFDYMLQLFKKLKQYTKLGLETVHQVLTSKFVCDICRLSSPKKEFLRPEPHIELLLYL